MRRNGGEDGWEMLKERHCRKNCRESVCVCEREREKERLKIRE